MGMSERREKVFYRLDSDVRSVGLKIVTKGFPESRNP